MKRLFLTAFALLAASVAMSAQPLMNQAKDMSRDYVDMTATYFFADRLAEFDAASGEGKVQWGRYSLEPRQAFNTNTVVMDRLPMKDFPESGYENDPSFRFKVDIISDRTVRVRMLTSLVEPKDGGEVMLSPDERDLVLRPERGYGRRRGCIARHDDDVAALPEKEVGDAAGPVDDVFAGLLAVGAMGVVGVIDVSLPGEKPDDLPVNGQSARPRVKNTDHDIQMYAKKH